MLQFPFDAAAGTFKESFGALDARHRLVAQRTVKIFGHRAKVERFGVTALRAVLRNASRVVFYNHDGRAVAVRRIFGVIDVFGRHRRVLRTG